MQTILMNLTAPQLRRAAELKDQISSLQDELEGLLTGDVSKLPNPLQLPLPRRRGKMSAATKAKIRAAAKKRWRKAWAAGRNSL